MLWHGGLGPSVAQRESYLPSSIAAARPSLSSAVAYGVLLKRRQFAAREYMESGSVPPHAADWAGCRSIRTPNRVTEDPALIVVALIHT
jgi:hypothetical protein